MQGGDDLNDMADIFQDDEAGPYLDVQPTSILHVFASADFPRKPGYFVRALVMLTVMACHLCTKISLLSESMRDLRSCLAEHVLAGSGVPGPGR